MKKIIILTLLVCVLSSVRAQYFSSTPTTYLVHTFNENGPTTIVRGSLEELTLQSTAGDTEIYQYKADSILVRGDSILLSQGGREVLLMVHSLSAGDSFSAVWYAPSVEERAVVLYIDSVVQRAGLSHTHFHVIDQSQNTHVNLTWVEGVGEITYGIVYNFPFLYVDMNMRFIAYCRNDELRYMNDEPWDGGDIDCNFRKTLSKLSTKDIETIRQVEIYPNPASNRLVVSGVEPSTLYTIRSMTGGILQQGSTDTQIAIAELSKGMYVLELQGGNGKRLRKKFVKR